MPTTYEILRADIVTAMKARDATAATALRTMDAAIQRAAIDVNKPIDEALVVATIRKAVKNLTDARAELEKGGRADLVAVKVIGALKQRPEAPLLDFGAVSKLVQAKLP